MTTVLYSLLPCDVGKASVEGMSSYVIRLAQSHHLLVRDLMRDILLPALFAEETINVQLSKSWWRHTSNSLNGLNLTTTDWIACIEALTGQSNLHSLTMATWSSVLPYRALLKTNCAWCPLCLDQWRQVGETVFYPLLWQLRAVQICADHLIALAQRCPYEDCRQTFYAITAKARLGFCPHCNRWLGRAHIEQNTPESHKSEVETQLWYTKGVGELLVAAARCETKPKRDVIGRKIEQFIEDRLDGSARKMALLLSVNHRTVYEWRDGTQLPQLDMLLRLSHLLEESPSQFLLTEPSVLVRQVTYPSTPVTVRSEKQKRSYRKLDKQGIKSALDEIFTTTAEKPTSLSSVARQLGYDSTFLRKHFPRICTRITERYRLFTAGNARLRRETEVETFRTQLSLLIKQGLYPSHRRLRPFFGRMLINPAIRALRRLTEFETIDGADNQESKI